jgi:hypothetical protein
MLLRPLRLRRATVSDRSGFDLVISSNEWPVMPRRPAEVGL